jgi:hypothetical protein
LSQARARKTKRGADETIGDDVGGIAVHIGARVAALAGASEVLVSSTGGGLRVALRREWGSMPSKASPANGEYSWLSAKALEPKKGIGGIPWRAPVSWYPGAKAEIPTGPPSTEESFFFHPHYCRDGKYDPT